MDFITILSDDATWTPISGTKVRIVTPAGEGAFENDGDADDFPDAAVARTWKLDSPCDLRSLARYLEKHYHG